MVYRHLYAIYTYTVKDGEKASDYPASIRVKGLRSRLHRLEVADGAGILTAAV